MRELSDEEEGVRSLFVRYPEIVVPEWAIQRILGLSWGDTYRSVDRLVKEGTLVVSNGYYRLNIKEKSDA